jgi:hypothetical protein
LAIGQVVIVVATPYRRSGSDIAEPLHGHINSDDSCAWRAGLAPAGERSGTLASMSFGTDDLARLAAAEEVQIETQAPNGPAHRTTIWVVVDEDEAFVRSYLGPDARWYREALANPAVAIEVDGRRLPATAIPANDPDSIERVSAAFREKYSPGPSTSAMATQHLDTTLRLEPT